MGTRVLLGFPGPSLSFAVSNALYTCGRPPDLTVQLANSGGGWDNFNALWCHALNEQEAGNVDMFAMLHSDVIPANTGGWLDILVKECLKADADLVSVAVPIKDARGLTSSGVGNPDNPWVPFRRFTVREVLRLPDTFSLEDAGKGLGQDFTGKYLDHNNGCWVADLRKPVFHQTNADGRLTCYFEFPKRITRGSDKRWALSGESEDWFFSRTLHAAKAKTFITHAVSLTHQGSAAYTNAEAWGTYEHGDEDTAGYWREAIKAQTPPPVAVPAGA